MIELNDIYVLAIMLNMSGIGVIYWDWKYLKRHYVMSKLSGWGLVLVALVLWCFRDGWEFGMMFWLMTSALSAWFFCLFDSQTQRQQQQLLPTEKRYRHQLLPRGKIAHALATFLVVGVVSLIACCLFSLALLTLLPGNESNKLVFIAFLFPVLWALTTYWICATEQLRKPLFSLTFISAASGLLLFL
ncbi:MAG: hypothetical protein HRU22_07175 [Gammaproteobacteria bacterium]|nr:hypothetical protein [Gammaproteobacteria bacterium]